MAIPFRKGRVVVAAFAQWFIPDTDWLGPDWSNLRVRGTRTAQVHPMSMPIEHGKGLERPLLTNVVNWLAPPGERDAKGQDQGGDAAARRRILAAHDVALRYELHILPREALVEAMNGLVANAAGDPWTEEALWIAAQSINDGRFFHTDAPDILFGCIKGEPPPVPDPSSYQKLADRFPTGALAPYARWWVAECLRRRNLVTSSQDQLTSMTELMALYEKVKAPPNTRAWAWSQLRLGWLRYHEGQHPEALEHFLAVANGVGRGPEQSMALIDAAYCYGARKQHAESERLLRLVLEQPDVVWVKVGEMSAWAPMSGSPHQFWAGRTSALARQWLSRIDELEHMEDHNHDGGRERGVEDPEKTSPENGR